MYPWLLNPWSGFTNLLSNKTTTFVKYVKASVLHNLNMTIHQSAAAEVLYFPHFVFNVAFTAKKAQASL